MCDLKNVCLRWFYRGLVLFFIVCTAAFGSRAQTISFNHLSVENGLSNNSVLSITQDRTGFLWFGTRLGVNRYDGSRFRNYVSNTKDSNTLYDNNVISLFCDSRKTIWAGTSSGLNRYNEEKDIFERIPLQNTALNINCIYEDKKGTLWIGSSNGLYALPNKQTKQAIVFKANQPNSIAGNNVRAVYEDHNGHLWVGSNNGLTRMIPQKNRYHFENFIHEPGNPRSLSAVHVTTITEDAKQQLWIGTQNSGLNLFDAATKTFTRYGKTGNSSSGLINNNIRIITSARNGLLWVGTQEGLSLIDPVTKNIQSHQNDPGNNKSLSQNSIYSLFEDANGSVWVGTYFGGVNSTYPYSTNFSVLQNHANRSSLSNNVVSSIVEDEQHHLWIGTEGGGLNFYNRTTGTFTVYKNNINDAGSLGSNLVKIVVVDKEQNIWCGTHGGGLNVLDRKQNIFKRYLYKENDATTLRSEIIALLEDNNNRLWVGSNQGLQLFSKKGTELTPLSFSSINGFVNGIPARTFFKDAQGAVWIGAAPGLYVVNGNSMKELSTDLFVNNITQDKKGNIWVALSYGGIAMYNNSNGGQFIRYTKKEGLPNENVISLLEDEQGFFWLSTDNGLVKYNPALKTAQTYTVSDGIAGNEFNYNSYLKDSRGEFFFGGYHGITSFLPGNIETNSYVAPVVFTGLRLFSNAVAINGDDGLLRQNINQTKRIVFTHKQNVFSIEFALLNYIKSNKNKYAYKLEGFDKNWNEVSTASATYTNLPSGTYTFLVKGANNDGVWSAPASIELKILPPFWLTWWAYCLYVLLFAAILFLIIRFFFLRELLKKEDELHQVKLNFFTNVSHEIRTHLTLIMAPVEKLMEKNDENSFVHQQLTQVKSNANRLLKLVSELMDFRKAETNHLNLHIQRHNLISFLQDIYNSFREMSLTKNISVSFIHNAEEVPLYFDKEQLEKVFFNLLANAFKFTPEGGRITLLAEQKDNQVTVTVTDNGRGIAPEYLDKLFTNFFQVADHGKQNTGYGIGLALSKNIVELHKGTIAVKSEPSTADKEGKTVFTVTLLQGNLHLTTEQTHTAAATKTIPAEQPVVASAHKPAQTTAATNEKPFTILLAEDNSELRSLIKETFAANYQVITCENGLLGWNTAVEQIPDLIISDVMMPEMDGFTLCEKLKTDERTSHIPVILLTAKSAQADQVSGLETGADLYLTKPFSTKILELNVRNLLAAREKLREHFSKQLTVLDEAKADTENEHNITGYANKIDKEFLERVIQIVNEHLDDPDFGVEKLSRKVAMSAPVLYKKIKAVSNMSVNEFVKSLRLKRAAQLLTETDLTVYEVSFTVGYNDRKYFSREFKKQFGKLPSEFKEIQ